MRRPFSNPGRPPIVRQQEGSTAVFPDYDRDTGASTRFQWSQFGPSRTSRVFSASAAAPGSHGGTLPVAESRFADNAPNGGDRHDRHRSRPASGFNRDSGLMWVGNSRNDSGSGAQQQAGPVIGRIINGAVTSGYTSVGLIGDNTGFFCSGTLIAARYVLTAAHCAVGVANTAGRFLVNGTTYSTSRVFVHPQYNDNTLANDIAIYELSGSVAGVTPSQIFRGTPVVGQVLTLVGFGGEGNGNSGSDGSFGTKRVGTTPIDGVQPTLLTWHFGNNSESNTAPGDSGGPAFLTVNGTQYLAGVTSGGSSANAGIGDHSFDTRVDAFQSWIDGIAGTTGGGGGGGGGGTDDHANSPGPSATRLTFNSAGNARGTGVLQTGADRDVFQFDLAANGTSTITLTGASGLDTYLRVYNSAGQLIGQNDDFGNSLNSRVSRTLNAGTYYASAGSYADSGTGSFTMDVNRTTTGGGGGGGSDDHGNTSATATLLTLNSANSSVVNAVAETGTDVDVFRFRPAANGNVVATASRLSGNIDTMLYIHNSAGQQIAYNDDWGNSTNAQTSFHVNANQYYYVRLQTWGNTSGGYQLKLNETLDRSSRSRIRPFDTVSLDFDPVGNRQQLSMPTVNAMTGQVHGWMPRLSLFPQAEPFNGFASSDCSRTEDLLACRQGLGDRLAGLAGTGLSAIS